MATAGMAQGRTVLICLHDAQAAGVPFLTLDLARALTQLGWHTVFALQQAGPLLDRFRALGPCFILAEGWDVTGLAAGLGADTPVLVITGAAAAQARMLAQAGHRSLVLTQEMAAWLRDGGHLPDLIAAQDAGARIVASMPATALALAADLGRAPDVLRPGIVMPPTPISAFRQARQWRHGDHGPVFIGAGHADWRKGFDLFVSAAWRIAARLPQARFVWLGARDRWAQGLADEAIGKGLALALPGLVDDAPAWYRAADAYLLTSRQDPGPTTVIHAAAVGTPFVGYAADIGIVGMTSGMGLFVPAGDIDAFARTACDLVAPSISERRTRRRLVRDQTAFAPYAAAVSALLSPPSDGAAT